VQSQVHYLLRNTKKTVCREQKHTGYYTAFLGLVESLQAVGCNVRINDFAAAEARPNYPIGVAGFPSAITKIDLPNPRIFGHGDFGLPGKCDAVARSSKFVTLIMPSEWPVALFTHYCGDKMWIWFTAIDTKRWPDLSQTRKRFDFVIYDKIRFHRAEYAPQVLQRVMSHMDSRGLTYTVLRYGQHHTSKFVSALTQARAMLFLCEHETQGLAYQEALASNIPVLAWDEGKLVDPELLPHLNEAMKITSVPYFDESCGMKFKLQDFETTCDAFWKKRASFTPRRYVQEHLSPEKAGKRYLGEYARIAAGGKTPRIAETQ
jgi:hypothetical protein